MAITNGYCTLAEIKASLNITDSVDDTALESAVTAASRMIDDYTERFFYVNGSVGSPVTRYYTALDPYTINIDDITTVSEVATDDNFDRTFGTVWSTTDYMVEPINNPIKSWPYNRVLAIGSYIFPYQLPQSVRVKGVWGFSAVPAEVNMAALIQSSRIFGRRQSPFGIAGSPDLGTVRLFSRLDADVEVLLRPYRKNGGLAK
ncbi:MAG: phage gp6-like head-tail connector protein [Cyanobacteria bacterium REEB494]|nr:phage gp6-like head-tail connector protein [Cyanobacteria bacterium REEB494]